MVIIVKKIIIVVISVLVLCTIFVVLQNIIPAHLTLKPDHLDMLVALDGEEDEYYEELTLRCNGIKVKAENANWHSDNTDVAEVDRYGWVTSMGVGKATITAEYRGASAKCSVVVTRKITSDTLGE